MGNDGKRRGFKNCKVGGIGDCLMFIGSAKRWFTHKFLFFIFSSRKPIIDIQYGLFVNYIVL
jgi:hypothetical protein